MKLSTYNNSKYYPGSFLKRSIWYYINELFFKNTLVTSSYFKIKLLKLFGCKVGAGVFIKPGVNIKYPWKLTIGNNCWIGEGVWIDNLDYIIIEDNVCLSQGAMLLCGNHNYKSQNFDLMLAPIILKSGSWVGAKSVVCPGVTFESHAILTVGSIANSNLESYSIYKGNPAKKIKDRLVL